MIKQVKSHFEDTVFRNSGLKNFLRNDSRKGNSMILFRILKNISDKIQKIEFYTTKSGTMLVKNPTVLALPNDKAQIEYISRIDLLQ